MHHICIVAFQGLADSDTQKINSCLTSSLNLKRWILSHSWFQILQFRQFCVSRNIVSFQRPRSRIPGVGLRFDVAGGSHGTGHLHISPILILAPTCRSVKTSNLRMIISNSHMFFHMKLHADLHFVFRCAEWGIPAHLTVLAAWSPR